MNIHVAHRKYLLWFIAIIITLSSAVYQRITGPTYPQKGSVQISGQKYFYRLLRSGIVGEDAEISLDIPRKEIGGYVKYRRYKSLDNWTQVELKRTGQSLTAYLPQQPAAGKLMYFVYLQDDDKTVSLTGDKPVILRFKGAVPLAVLIPHVLFMFLGMLYSNRTALEALDPRGNACRYMMFTIGFLVLGGLLFGPIVQKYAFGEFWTGVPFGYDLTDNKTLIAVVGWLLAWVKNRKGRDGRGWILFAAVLTLVVFLIPHSVLGSELDYTKP